ncbi:hypothetical protein [Roseomonas sp. BN140053]|uniref:hypothetical protein n=1 Tax=Roseomonas sp. BN140053 TaxID=3391898 RepID=UPI0039E87562
MSTVLTTPTAAFTPPPPVPVAAGLAPTPDLATRREQLLSLARTMSADQVHALANLAERVAGGMAPDAAGALFEKECAALDPAPAQPLPVIPERAWSRLDATDATRAAVAGYAAWVRSPTFDEAHYGVTLGGEDVELGVANRVGEAKKAVVQAIVERFAPVGTDGQQAIRQSGVAHLLPKRRKAKQWDPLPRLRAVDKASRHATTAAEIWACFDELAAFIGPDPSCNDYPSNEAADAAADRWNDIEARLLRKLAKAPDLSPRDMQRMLRLVGDDHGVRGNGYPHPTRILAVLRRVERELVAQLKPPAPADADAELVALCAQHITNMDNYNRDGGILEYEVDPLWQAYERTRDAIHAAVPQTLAGMLAKARAAKAEARGLRGDENPDNTPAEYWAWDLVNDLLRLASEAVPAIALPAALKPSPAGQMLADLVRLHQEERREREGGKDSTLATQQAMWAAEMEFVQAVPTNATEAVAIACQALQELDLLDAFEADPGVQTRWLNAMRGLLRSVRFLAGLHGIDVNAVLGVPVDESHRDGLAGA